MSSSSRKRPRGPSGDESNSWPSTNTEIQHCLYPGCRKLPHGTCSGSDSKFCGILHCDLFMNNLAVSRRALPAPSAGQERMTSSWTAEFQQFKTIPEGDQNCMLRGCTKKVWRDPNTGQHFEFCGKRHMLEMVEAMTKVWSLEGRLCGLEECCRHVYVKDDGTSYHYCGQNHAILAAKRKGAKQMPEAAAVAASNFTTVENRHCVGLPDPDRQAAKIQLIGSEKQGSQYFCHEENNSWTIEESLVDSERGYHDKISDSELERLLKDGSDSDRCEAVQHGVDIYEFHPWELVTKFGGFRPRYFLLTTSQEREHKGQIQKRRKTKEGFSWKQSGPTHAPENQVLQTRYLKYMLEKADRSADLPYVQVYGQYNLQRDTSTKPGKSAKRRGPKCRWKMHEITLRHSLEEFHNGPRKAILMMFQEAQGQPEWPPSRQRDHSSQLNLPISIPRRNEDIVEDPTPPAGTDLNALDLQIFAIQQDMSTKDDGLLMDPTFSLTEYQDDSWMDSIEDLFHLSNPTGLWE